MAKIRQEILIVSANQAFNTSQTYSQLVQLDTTAYDGTVTYNFEVVFLLAGTVTGGSFRLRRNGTTTDDATIAYTTGSTSAYAPVRVSLTPPAATQTVYFLLCDTPTGTTPQVTVTRASIIINQSGYTKTQTQIPAIAQSANNVGMGVTSTTFSPPVGWATFWLYTSGNWDGTITANWEIVWKSDSTKNTQTAELQVDDGTFANWAAVGSDQTTTSTSVVRSRSGSVTLTTARNYRVVVKTSSTKNTATVYNAAIILTQTASPTKHELQYVLGATATISNGLIGFVTKYDATEWSGVTNNYFHGVDFQSSDTTGVLTIVDASSVTLSNSTLNAPSAAKQLISSAMPMPFSQNLSLSISSSISGYGARILVQVVKDDTADSIGMMAPKMTVVNA